MIDIERNSNLSYRVTQLLGRAIVCGEIERDEVFPTEAELCARFGVSRTAIREAVKMLSAKGLVASKPRQGIRILAEEDWNIFDPDLLRWSLEGEPTRLVLKEFFQMRIAIEPEAAALAARFASTESLDAIAAALQRMREVAAEVALSRAADVDFHVAILYATGNRFYVRMRDFIRTALDVSIRFTSTNNTNHFETLEAHAQVHRAIAENNVEDARRRMRDLINAALLLVENDTPDDETPDP